MNSSLSPSRAFFTPETQETPRPLSQEWIPLASYGNWPHGERIQYLDERVAQALVAHFKGLRGTWNRLFRRVPVYLGHPDDPHFAQDPVHQDGTPYGWVMQLEARCDALWALIKWTPEGRLLHHKGPYGYCSPRWVVKAIDPSGRYLPIRLVSVGLTAHPNIPVLSASALRHFWETLLQRLELSHLSPPEAVLAHIQEMMLDYRQEHLKLYEELNRLKNASPRQATPAEGAKAESAQAQHVQALTQKCHALQTQLEACQTYYSEYVVEQALQMGKIGLAERQRWLEQLKSIPEAACQALEDLPSRDPHPPALPPRRVLGNLATRQPWQSVARFDWLSAVAQRMRQTGETYLHAWKHIKRENPLALEGALG